MTDGTLGFVCPGPGLSLSNRVVALDLQGLGRPHLSQKDQYQEGPEAAESSGHCDRTSADRGLSGNPESVSIDLHLLTPSSRVYRRKASAPA